MGARSNVDGARGLVYSLGVIRYGEYLAKDPSLPSRRKRHNRDTAKLLERSGKNIHRQPKIPKDRIIKYRMTDLEPLKSWVFRKDRIR